LKKGVTHFLSRALFPPGYKNLENKNLSPFLRIKKDEKAFFNIPAIEASINSRWHKAMAYWIRPLGLYAIFLMLFTNLPTYYFDYFNNETYEKLGTIGVGIFYYIGIYLLITEFMQIRKYKKKYFTMFNIFDLSGIILGIITFSLRFSQYDLDVMHIVYTIAALILWIEMVCLITFEIIVF
jgi:hypothetical protein